MAGGNDRHECSLLLDSASGGTSVLLEGTTVLATQHLEPGRRLPPRVTRAFSPHPGPVGRASRANRRGHRRGPPVGDALAELLGLELEPSFKAALPCAYWQGRRAGGYCLADRCGRGRPVCDRRRLAWASDHSGRAGRDHGGIQRQGLGVDDPPIAKIPIFQERIVSVEARTRFLAYLHDGRKGPGGRVDGTAGFAQCQAGSPLPGSGFPGHLLDAVMGSSTWSDRRRHGLGPGRVRRCLRCTPATALR